MLELIFQLGISDVSHDTIVDPCGVVYGPLAPPLGMGRQQHVDEEYVLFEKLFKKSKQNACQRLYSLGYSIAIILLVKPATVVDESTLHFPTVSVVCIAAHQRR